jgi:hypothetical protein
MVAVGFGLIWGGYAVGLWGWCLLQGYDITFGQLVSPLHSYSQAWPPGPIPAGQVFPGKNQATAATAATTGGSTSSNSGGPANPNVTPE